MKKNLLLITIISMISLASCGDNDAKSTSNDTVETTIMQEKELAKEASEESKTAKEEAQKTEEAVDKLLEDI